MIVNAKETEKKPSHVEFVSYSGKWPTLCGGTLVLKIDGTGVKFGNKCLDKTAQYPTFWHSGGECTMDYCSTADWVIDVAELPEEFQKYAEEIDEVFNSNVEHGCCSGCR